MTEIENQINAMYEETVQSVNSIIEGSDEHLDLILSVTKPLDSLTDRLTKLNESLDRDLQNYPDDVVKDQLFPKLKDLNRISMTLIGAVNRSFLYKDIRTSFKNYLKQHDFLREIIYDLSNFRIKKDSEFDSLLSKLNEI
jgi:hypothetical protein